MLWTDSERARLLELIPRHSVRTIAGMLGRSKSSVNSALQRLQLGRPKLDTWSQQEADLLYALWPTHSAGIIAKRLGRSRDAVIGKVDRMRRHGTELTSKRTRWMQDELPRPKSIPPPPKPRPPIILMTKPQPQPKPPAVIQCPCQLVELEPVNCKWPYGDPHLPGFYFCGAIRLDGSPYCRQHFKEAHDRNRYAA